MTCLLRRLRRQHGRRFGCALLLIMFALTAAGVPLPTGRSPQDRGELFPCSSCKCGCASAEQCWKSCCCHTLAQRLAWAREHGVKPPAFALANASPAELAEVRCIGLLVDELTSKTCCDKKGTEDAPSCCRKKQLTVVSSERTCCRKHIKQPMVTQVADKVDNSIVGWRALKCRGQAAHWLAAVPTLVAVRLDWSRQLPCVAWLGPAASEHGEGVSDDPAVPPPERA